MVRYETKEELRRAVEQRVNHPIRDDTWEMAQPDWDGPYDDSDLQEISGYVPIEKELLEPTTLHTAKKGVPESRTYKSLRKVFEQARSESKQRTLEEADYVASVRQQLFGNVSPPCQDLDAMRQWIRRQAEIDGPPTVHTEGSITLNNGQVVPKRSWVDTLDWPGDDNWVERVTVVEDKTLGKLRKAANSLAGRIGCEPAAAVAHVLTGKIPLIAPIRYTLSLKMSCPTVTLKVNYSWVPAEVVRSTYINALKEARDRLKIISMKRARSSPISARARLFLAENKDKDWWEVLKLWNEQNPQNQYRHPRYLYRLKN